MRRVPVLYSLVGLYISYVRGIPLVVHLLVVNTFIPKFATAFLGLVGVSQVKPTIPSLLIILVTYILYEAAIETENIRGAFQSFDGRQMEAGLSIGMTTFQVFRRIVLPQVAVVALPVVLNAYLKNIKSLSLAFTVGFVEIMQTTRYAAALNNRYIESYVAAALVYWGICGILQQVFDHLEIQKWGKKRG
ncbi:Amino acid ABC transporter, permease protein [Streptococcus sp. DD13]|nr:Amino acid ABC transporter, permease protein [Streptococcus sp. DD13]